jgi:hypothetical protein
MIPPIETATCEGEEIILLFQNCLPPPISHLWLGSDDMLSMLNEGGITCYTTANQIANCMRAQKLIHLDSNRRNGKRWFAFQKEMAFPDPKQQLKENKQPLQLEPNYFTNLGIKFKFIGKKSQSTNSSSSKNSSRHTTATSSATSPAAAANNNNNNSTDNNNNNSNNNNTQLVTPDTTKNNNNNTPNTANKVTASASAAATTNNNDNVTTKRNKSSIKDLSSDTGFMISRLDLPDDIVRVTEEHSKQCPGNCSLHTTRKSKGFEVITALSCGFCKKSYTISSEPKPEKKQKQTRRGAPTSQLNMMVTNAFHKNGITIEQGKGFCAELGCVSLSETGMHGSMVNHKDAVEQVSEEVLQENRLEHVREMKKLYPEQIIVHKDADGVTHNITYGGACGDGAGDKRAYKHIITGSQHCTVIFSALTGKVLAIKHDQISCAKCDRKLTQLYKQNGKFDDITAEQLQHDGECSRNSKHGPAVAEEYAMEYLAEYLLKDPVTNKLRSDEEAILVDWFIADGDTKGAVRFIKKQASIIPNKTQRKINTVAAAMKLIDTCCVIIIKKESFVVIRHIIYFHRYENTIPGN